MDVNVNREIEDTMIDVPIPFDVGDNHLYLYPKTLGYSILISHITQKLKINQRFIALSPLFETMKVVKENRDSVLRIISLCTLQGKKDAFDELLIRERMSIIGELEDAEVATLLIYALEPDRTDDMQKYLKLDVERNQMKKINNVKSNNSTLTFNGKSIYGTLISPACEKYGWTYDYVMWGISYSNLKMMLADSVTTVFLSEDEKKKAHISTDGMNFDMNDSKQINDAIMMLSQDSNVKIINNK